MASEHAYSNGQRLRALVTSFQLGVTMKSILTKWEPRDEDSWDAKALELNQCLSAEMISYRRQMGAAHPTEA